MGNNKTLSEKIRDSVNTGKIPSELVSLTISGASNQTVAERIAKSAYTGKVPSEIDQTRFNNQTVAEAIYTSVGSASTISIPIVDAGVKIIAMGDSIVARNHDPQTTWASPGEVSNGGKGALTMAKAKVPRFKFYAYFLNSDATYGKRGGTDLGVSGQTSTQMLARISDATGRMADGDIFYLSGGTNDIRDASAPSATTIFNNLTAMIETVRATKPNSPVIFNTLRATASTSEALAFGIDATQLARMLDVNNRIRAYCSSRSWCRLCDVFLAYALPSGYADSSLTDGDGLHPNTMGTGIETVDFLVPVLTSLIRPGSALETGTNLWAFPFGTPGGDTANGCSGTVPNGLRVTRTVGSGSTTCVSSLVTENSVDKVQLDFTVGGSIVEQFRLAANNTFNNVTVSNNAWVKFLVDVEVEDKTSIVGVDVESYRDDTSTSFRSFGAKYQPTVGYHPKSYRGNFTISTEAQPTAGTTFSSLVRMVVAIDGNIGGTVRIKFSNPRFIEVPDPSTL